MTRFARAKGSKASNERIPNEATPWHVMKEQLTENTTMKDQQPAKIKSAKELLSEKNDLYYCDTLGNVNNAWAEFDTSDAKEKKLKKRKEGAESEDTPSMKKKKKLCSPVTVDNGNCEAKGEDTQSIKKKKKMCSPVAVENENCDVKLDTTNDGDINFKKSKKKQKLDSTIQSASEIVNDQSENVDETETKDTKIKKKKKNKETLFPKTDNTEVNEPKKRKKGLKRKSENMESEEKEEMPKEEQGEDKEEIKSTSKENTGKISKRHKRNQKRKNKMASLKAAENEGKQEVTMSGTFDAAGNDWNSKVNFGNGQQEEPDNMTGRDQSSMNKNGNNNLKKRSNGPGPMNNGAKRKAPKIRDDKEHKRRKPDNGGSMKCIINGMEVEIVKYDGFPVKKEDADRLKELRKQMVMKGIPKSEIDSAMKLERRKAEKALARVRKQVCFHCRKAGHNLSDCPELGKEESATGICFKCGSTEHTHFECRVTKKEEFRYASCFICREQGHIAKQCPDNPKGLYPQGGACKICGDVTHLKKDCPDLTKEKEENTVTLGTITENTIESLDDHDSTKKNATEGSKRPKSKVVKF